MASHMAEPKASPLKGSKLPLIVTAIVAGVLLVVYLAGVAVFSLVYMPGTTLDGQDVSLMSVEEVAQAKTDALSDYEAQVTGNGVELTIGAPQIDLTYDGNSYAQEALEKTDPWAWPVGVATTHSVSAQSTVVFDRDALVALLEPFVKDAQKSAEDLEGASVVYDAEAGAFTFDSSIQAQYLDVDTVVERLAEAFAAGETQIVLGPDTLLPGDDKVHQAMDAANAYLGAASTTLTMDGEVAVEVTVDVIASWVSVSEDLAVSLDEEALLSWVSEQVDGLNTVGTERTYTRPDGKEITVSGGSYGWQVDDEGVAEALLDAVSTGTASEVEITCSKTAEVAPDEGGRDWGNRYIDIDLSEQHARMYDESGELIWESDIVSGDTSKGYGTPTGVNAINSNKNVDQTLIGLDYDDDGEPDYESFVNYWMPFVGNLIALHDASWRSYFGDTIYQWDGSHGCVNLPLDKAAELYDITQIGDVVVVHW